MIRVDILGPNHERITEPVEGPSSHFPGTWWPAEPGARVAVRVAVRPEILALYPQLPYEMVIELTGIDTQ